MSQSDVKLITEVINECDTLIDHIYRQDEHEKRNEKVN